MAVRHVSAVLVCAYLVTFSAANIDGFLGVGHRRGGAPAATEEDFRGAMGSVMGCGGDVAAERLAAVEKDLRPMWRVLPKNEQGLVDWPMVRYLAHRYFMQQSSLLVRGFEPMRRINASSLGAAEILTNKVPSAEGALEGKRSSAGFSLEDAVAMVATLEQLIWDSEGTLLATVYEGQQKSTKAGLSHAELSNILEAYMVHWMMEDDDQVIKMLLSNHSMLHEALPKWDDIKDFLGGVVSSMEFTQRHAGADGRGQVVLDGEFSFDDAHKMVGTITRTFASFWEGECQLIKESLAAMDRTGTGRVSLSDFYGANADGEWRFGESEQYLRELGALDESSTLRGKQVIIPNYMQGASNCLIARSHYLVCCVSECEAVLNDVEAAVGGALARPDEILALVGNMSDLNDVPPLLDVGLRTQLSRIAETHGGKVPLHGRLFAQWLHYVFPLECPFPHKTGTATALTPSQFGDASIASDDEVYMHAADRGTKNESLLLADRNEAQWMSQWSEDEELIADYALLLRAPWERTQRATLVAIALGVMVLIVVVAARSGGQATRTTTNSIFASGVEVKSHFV
mmetsp:Transcript_18096/g.49630  ORF Transcript_18096/g.49630 Transcript_18096/m.49630 type:complete len:572 (-) Transcript_18096:107-1822(-)|eukprot:CAMPEP_0117515394 /NCGR_PEP_ID=MMETSP0784-20121206/30557_1 /TAXON_ID=39447 /ORGANISM="" /LENGTH=571 /DNA_ID=CAMNT_0005311209 /DNA_START=80 /DNA_END=1795 /DNA_ORIENTATION=+